MSVERAQAAEELLDGREIYEVGFVCDGLASEPDVAALMRLAADRTLGLRPGAPYYGFELSPDGLLTTPSTNVGVFRATEDLLVDLDAFRRFIEHVKPDGSDHEDEVLRILRLLPESGVRFVSSPPEPAVTHALANSLLLDAASKGVFAASFSIGENWDSYQTSNGEWRELAF